jgi:hypothetical protein
MEIRVSIFSAAALRERVSAQFLYVQRILLSPPGCHERHTNGPHQIYFSPNGARTEELPCIRARESRKHMLQRFGSINEIKHHPVANYCARYAYTRPFRAHAQPDQRGRQTERPGRPAHTLHVQSVFYILSYLFHRPGLDCDSLGGTSLF